MRGVLDPENNCIQIRTSRAFSIGWTRPTHRHHEAGDTTTDSGISTGGGHTDRLTEVAAETCCRWRSERRRRASRAAMPIAHRRSAAQSRRAPRAPQSRHRLLQAAFHEPCGTPSSPARPRRAAPATASASIEPTIASVPRPTRSLWALAAPVVHRWTLVSAEWEARAAASVLGACQAGSPSAFTDVLELASDPDRDA